MSAPTRAARIAILSVHSHGDRSFLDDADLALVSGDLRGEGVENDLVLVGLGGAADVDARAFAALLETLAAYDTIVYERVWSVELVEKLRAALPGRVFIHCGGEHILADPPADWVCVEDMRQTLSGLLAHLRGARSAPLPGTLERTAEGWKKHETPNLLGRRERRYAPNLHPKIVNPEAFPGSRTFSINGNNGCPYQADARDNPLYAGVTMPEGVGKGCAFCTTGNKYDGRPARETGARVLEQIRYVRREAPEQARIVLKDQNPFAYLTEVVETLAQEGAGPFTLMLETRADWLTRSAARFDAALAAASRSRIRIVPFLVGIENFSQPELDRYNKGTTAEANVEFLEWLWTLRARHGEALDLDAASFGFVLFSPWTTIDDLRVNHAAILRTRFHKLRGRVLLSRTRLYPDTALYYLAERDGLFVEDYRPGEDSSRRYGYFPARPWRFVHADTAHFAALAIEVVERNGGRDEMRIFGALLEAFDATADWPSVTADVILARLRATEGRGATEGSRASGGRGSTEGSSASSDLRARLEKLVRPLSLDVAFADGWRIRDFERAKGAVRVHLAHDRESIVLEIAPRDGTDSYAHSRHYVLRHDRPALTPSQRRAVDAVCDAIATNDH